MNRRLGWVALAAACAASTAPPPGPGPGPGPMGDSVALHLVTGALTSPVYLTAPVGDTSRLFVVEQTGRIRVLLHDSLLPTPFLDVSGHITAGGEQGLLSLAFHPEYAQNGRFFVYFTDPHGDSRVVRYTVSLDPDVADSSSGDTILAVAQPFPNHNGGLLRFGPEGDLYVGLGDGGSGGDPQGNGQSLNTLLGKILRIDVDGGQPYVIPPDNPFVGVAGARSEIWAYGLRNPWRFSFDRNTNDLYIGDVGQNAWEEVDVQPAGGPAGRNYGWNVMEGTHCYGTSSCNQAGLVLPVTEYGHGEGCSITGGVVYRGGAIASLQGRYLYGDYCGGWVRSFRYAGGAAVEPTEWPSLAVSGGLSSFGEDQKDNVYVLTLGGGLYRIVPAP